MGVDYVYGQVESTGGSLWVVGRDPMLFDYFLPEKWRRTPRTKISASQQVYETVTKDNIHLVWRVSRVGQIPDADPFVRRERQILDYGYNSPFEEFCDRHGIVTPRHRDDVSASDLHDGTSFVRLVVVGRQQPLRQSRRSADARPSRPVESAARVCHDLGILERARRNAGGERRGSSTRGSTRWPHIARVG